MLAISLALHGLLAAAIGLVRFPSALPAQKAGPATIALVLMSPAAPEVAFVPPKQATHTDPAGTVEVATQPMDGPSTPAVAFLPHSSTHIQLRSPLAPATAPRVDHHAGTVFVLDVSGSMYEGYAGANRLAYARRALSDAVHALRPGTPFALVVYAERACISGPLVPANAETVAAADAYLQQEYDFGGGTDLPAGLALAESLRPGRIVVATDGDLNAHPRDLLAAERDLVIDVERPPTLDFLAIAPRTAVHDDSILHQLADEANGSYQLYSAPGNGN
jgi:hypothetical protein